MPLDPLTTDIEEIESDGAVVLVKWDGERSSLRRTVVITRADTDYVFRLDTDDVVTALREAISNYRAAHSTK